MIFLVLDWHLAGLCSGWTCSSWLNVLVSQIRHWGSAALEVWLQEVPTVLHIHSSGTRACSWSLAQPCSQSCSVPGTNGSRHTGGMQMDRRGVGPQAQPLLTENLLDRLPWQGINSDNLMNIAIKTPGSLAKSIQGIKFRFYLLCFSLGCVLTFLTYARRAMGTALTHSCSKLLLILSNHSAASQCPSSIHCFLSCVVHWWALCAPNGALWKKMTLSPENIVSLLIGKMHSLLAIGSFLSPHASIYWKALQTRREGGNSYENNRCVAL